MTDKEFDKKIADALRSHTEEPPADMFQRIEDTLAATASKRARIRIQRYIAVAAALLAAVTTVLYLARPLPDAMPMAQEEQPAAQHTETPAAETPAPQPVTVSESSVAVHTADTRTAPSAHSHSDETTTLATPPTEPTHAAVPTQSASAQSASTEQPVTVPEHPATASERPAALEDSHRSTSTERDTYENGAATAAQWDRLIAQDARSRKHRGRRISASLYAGNAGIGSNSTSNSPAVAASYDMYLDQKADASVGNNPMISDDSGRPLGIPTNYDTESIELRHRMPLNVGLTLAIPLNDRLAITTGISYSYLYSATTQSFVYGTGSVTRELHYIGIPVGVAYTFFRTGDFSFYVQGGGMIEKGIAWRETYGMSSTDDRSSTSEHKKINGVQFSVNASAGISYEFNRHFALYVEPGVGYYFSNATQPASYRTAHPTNFNIKIGFRFGI